jgi:hypothetical protein
MCVDGANHAMLCLRSYRQSRHSADMYNKSTPVDIITFHALLVSNKHKCTLSLSVVEHEV